MSTRYGWLVVGVVWWIGTSGWAQSQPRETVYGIDTQRRVPWSTSKIVGSPDPADPYVLENAFKQLKFTEPLAMCLVPGTNQFAVATRSGKIFTFDIDPLVQHAELLIDLKKVVYGLAFHPQFQQNGYFYVSNFANPSLYLPQGAHLSRFTVESPSAGKPLVANNDSEQLILEWPSGGHNGGCLRFGPDGMLYLSIGDSSGIADELMTGQDISDLSGSILRIDVEHSSAAKPYSIPPDNPFTNRAEARGEIWSYGHRNVWKFAFDEQRRMWAGDVGQDLWEAIYVIERGGNYGWSVQEAGHPFRPLRARGQEEILPPLVEHSHSEFRSVTGGYVSQTDRLPDIKGAYLYGDYDTGKIWSLKYDGHKITAHRQLADTQLRVVEFGLDRAGEVYIVDFVGGGIHRLVKADLPKEHGPPFPRKLSETGLFASTKEHIPAPGVLPYSVNAPLWSDHAEKDRFLALPNQSQIEFDDVFYPHQPDYPDLGWRFPDGTVLVKTFSLAMDVSQPNKLRRIETRLLHYRQMPGNDDEYGAQLWNAYTYVWNEAQDDGELVESSGANLELFIKDPQSPNGVRRQVWRLPSRAECALCHTMGSKYILGLTTLQMNKYHDYGHGPENQLAVLDRLGIFKNRLPNPPERLPQLVDYREEHQPLHLRARAYLHANCAHCHRKWGGGNAEFELQASLPLADTQTVHTRPGQGTFGIDDPRIIVPGDPQRSLVLARMKLEGLGRMPHIGSTVPDLSGIETVERWITELKNHSQLASPGALRPRVPLKQRPTWFTLHNTAALTTLLGIAGLVLMIDRLRRNRNSIRAGQNE